MSDNNNHHSHRLGLFLLVSVLIHAIAVLSYYLLRSPDGPKIPPLPGMSLAFSASPAANAPQNTKQPPTPTPATTAEHNKPENVVTEEQHSDAWQQGIATVRRLMQQPDFFEQLQDKTTQIPNYRPDLFATEPAVTELTIDTYRLLDNGEMDVVFRYPSGKKVCVRARQPDPMDPFDFGSWALVVAGCQ